MLTRADKPFIGLVKKHNCRPVPLYGVVLNTNKLFAHLWVARFVFSSLLFKPHGFLIPLIPFCIYSTILLYYYTGGSYHTVPWCLFTEGF